jgi:hypothetical protein
MMSLNELFHQYYLFIMLRLHYETTKHAQFYAGF